MAFDQKIVETSEQTNAFIKQPIAVAFILAVVKLMIFVSVGNQYGYFRDELYFLESTNHLASGYPDHAPLSIWIGWFSKIIFGDSLHAIRLFPALAGALKIILTGLIVRELGGKHLAILLACLSVLIVPVYLGIDNLMSMNSYEPIFWTGCVLCYIWAKKRGNPHYWLLFGALAGLGLMNKHSFVFFGIALILGLLLTKDRKFFAEKNLWLAAGIAFFLFLPNLIWQMQNDWATLELLRNVGESGKNIVLAPHAFMFEQAFILHPLTLPVWLAGLWFFLFNRDGKNYRALGIAYLVTLLLMIALKAKNYYLVPVYPMLFAAGGVFWENLSTRFIYGKIVVFVYAAILLVGGAVFAPLAIPVLPVEKFIAYQETLGLAPPKTEVAHTGVLPQLYGDMFGWENMTEKVAEVYNSLPEEERTRTAILAENYGQAGAVDFFGRNYNLPKAISPHQSYYLWGHGDYDGSVLILLGYSEKSADKYCGSVEEKAKVDHPYSMNYEKFTILVCRDLKEPLPRLWKKIKNWK